MNWAGFAKAAPTLAEFGRGRLVARDLALLGTLRPDGTPRISPIQPFFLGQELVIGVMRSAKARDLLADPRCTLHSAVSQLNGSDGEFKIHGRAIAVSDAQIVGAEEGWWAGRKTDTYWLYALDIGEAVGVSWDLERGRVRFVRWTPGAGPTESERPYP
jgi:hypothetical protein